MSNPSFFAVFSLAAGAVLFAGISSCNKLLQVPPNKTDQIVTSQVFQDSANAAAGVLGLYGSRALTGWDMDIDGALSADELLSIGSSTTNAQFYQYTLQAGNQTVASSLAPVWSAYYDNTCIYQANAAIEGIEASGTLSPSVKDQFTGECKVVRALAYFYLVECFGGVPLVTTADFQHNMTLPRATLDDVFRQIKTDLLDAQARLRPDYPSAGHQRPNEYTAAALLSRLYLYRGQWDSAAIEASRVINSGLYSLASLDSIFLDGSTEAIWQLSASTANYSDAAPNANSSGGSPFAPFSSYFAPDFVIAPSLLQAFEAGDQRYDHWVGIADVTNYTTGVITRYYYPNKYKKGSGYALGPLEDLMMLRLTEQYLIRAEALAQQGNWQGAMDDLNLVRFRAGLPPGTFNNLTDAMKAITQERRIELFSEWGHRWFDLKRTGTVGAVMSQTKPSFWPADGHAALYPIPYLEILYNGNLQQNPGY